MKRIFLLPFLFYLGCDPQNKSEFTIDSDGPWYVAHIGSFKHKIVEVRLYVTGPHRDFDSYVTVPKLLALKPQFVSRDTNEIDRALFALGDYSEALVPSNVIGLTYHILLFESEPSRLMHFRVFAQSIHNDQRLSIYPRATGFGYSNTRICSWLNDVTAKTKH